MLMYIFIFLILFIFFCIINNCISKKYIEKFDNNIIFLNNVQLLNILINNNDKYYDKFYGNDFNARNIKNIDEYKHLMKQCVADFNDIQKKKIKKCISNADSYFSKLNLEWFNGNKNNKIKWIIGSIKGKLYENGLPHTRNNVIIMSHEKINNYSESFLTKTLIHEKVHIYQKNHSDDIEIYLNKNKFSKIKERNIDDNIRANPDLDNWIYKDNKGNIYKAMYKDNPSSIEDIEYKPFDNQSYEHPFERMAIEIENKYNI